MSRSRSEPLRSFADLAQIVDCHLAFGVFFRVPDHLTQLYSDRQSHPWVIIRTVLPDSDTVVISLRTSKGIDQVQQNELLMPAHLVDYLDRPGKILLNVRRTMESDPFNDASVTKRYGMLPEEWCMRLRAALDTIAL